MTKSGRTVGRRRFEEWAYVLGLAAALAAVLIEVSRGRIDSATALSSITTALVTLSMLARGRRGDAEDAAREERQKEVGRDGETRQ